MLRVPSFFRFTLLDKGYFPKELPPPFTTHTFAKFAEKNPEYIVDKWKEYRTKLVKHNLARPGTNRRVLGIPNPINQMRLVDVLEHAYPDIIYKINDSPYSSSQPEIKSRRSRRALSPKWVGKSLIEHKAKIRSKARYIVRTDISRFYPSIYTHSIPWALHGKMTAKLNKGKNLIGNVIDKIIREAQDGQTIGLPIGPDSSFLIAELILSQVDFDVCTITEGTGWRWYDDYEIGFWDLQDAEAFACKLEKCLASYELEINSEKTQILKLPQPLHEAWINQIRPMSIHSHSGRQIDSLIEMFSTAFDLARSYPKAGVLKYAIRKLYGADKNGLTSKYEPIVHKYNWDMLQHLVLQAAIVEPDCLPTAIGLLSFYTIFDRLIDTRLLDEVLSSIITNQCRVGFASEVAWAIWAFIEFNIPITSIVAERASDLDDDIVGLLILHAKSLGLIAPEVSLDSIKQRVCKSTFDSDHWLLTYESYHHNWFGSPETDALLGSKYVPDLLSEGVCFYRTKFRKYEAARHVFGTPSWLLDEVPY